MIGRPDREQHLQVCTQRGEHCYPINIGRAILGKIDRQTCNLGAKARRIAVMSNKRVFNLYGKRAIKSLRRENLLVSCWLMGEGERFKSFESAEKAVGFLSEMKIERDDAVIALGGGVVGDLAGFAAAIYLRGVKLIQVPTTLLAQIDSSVGGKTGVNLPVGKNLVGSFHQPSAVLIDVETLATLPQRELISGWCEAVKHGIIAGEDLFKQTTGFLARIRSGECQLISPELEKLIAAHCAFKASIVVEDEREATERSDRRSRRTLNFGHTVGHALEAVTGYRRFRHGEAVGHGMLVAAEVSKTLGLLQTSELELLQEAVQLCGPLPPAHDLDLNEILRALKRDKKSVAGQIHWILLEHIGRPRVIEGKEIPQRLLRASLRAGLQKAHARH